mmetsp:Transcript_17247/g.27872  ORF Transcript_17247/g.27872 Transcript_17247/m.27872 type:complete len:81 (-) Transcript_17247:237-479(-)
MSDGETCGRMTCDVEIYVGIYVEIYVEIYLEIYLFAKRKVWWFALYARALCDRDRIYLLSCRYPPGCVSVSSFLVSQTLA